MGQVNPRHPPRRPLTDPPAHPPDPATRAGRRSHCDLLVRVARTARSLRAGLQVVKGHAWPPALVLGWHARRTVCVKRRGVLQTPHHARRIALIGLPAPRSELSLAGTVHGDAGRLAARARARPRAPPRRRTASSGQISPDHPRRVALTHRLPRARSQVRSMVGKARADHFSPKIKYYRPRPVHRRHRRRRDGLRMRAREHGRHGRHGRATCVVWCVVWCVGESGDQSRVGARRA